MLPLPTGCRSVMAARRCMRRSWVLGPDDTERAKMAAAKEFIKYMLEPKVLNQYLKGGLDHFAIPIPEIAKSDPFWLEEDPHRTVHTERIRSSVQPRRSTRRTTRRSPTSMLSTSSASPNFDVMKNGMAAEQPMGRQTSLP